MGMLTCTFPSSWSCQHGRDFTWGILHQWALREHVEMCHQLSFVGQWLMGGKKWRSAKGCESVKVTEMCWVLAAKNKYMFYGYGEK